MDFFVLGDVTGFTLFAWLFSCSYFVLMIFLMIGLLRLRYSRPDELTVFPSVSVVVSSRNEEQDLPSCIAALEKLDYPEEKLDVILVNDRSTDNTWDIIQQACERNPHFHGYDTSEMKETHLEAKGRGIAHGFAQAKGEWVFITDADSEVHPKWIKGCLSLADEKTGMVGGALMVKPVSLLAQLERVCWAFVQMFNLGMAGWGVPFACVGPNMAIRKSIYDDAGGLENSEFSVAEDLALLKMVTHAGYNIKSYMDRYTSASLKPVPSFGHLVSQQRRWFRGGIDNDPQYLWVLAIAFGWGFFVSSYILFGWLLSLKLYIWFTAIKIVIDVLFLFLQRYRLGTNKYTRYFWLLELYHPVICSILPASFVFTKKIYWKGDDYEILYD